MNININTVGVDQEVDNTIMLCKYCRAIGKGVGVFLIIWGWMAIFKWDYSYLKMTSLQCLLNSLLGGILILPVEKIESRRGFKVIYIMMIVLSVLFVFSQIFETIFQYHLASQLNMKSKQPILQSVLVFFTLLQLPAIFFYRNPKLIC